MSGQAGRKTAKGEQVTAGYRKLMFGMDSPNGDWNPDPDQQTTGLLRTDVQVSANQIKIVALVKACCIRDKPGGRTAFGKTERGEPLILARICDYFQWDPSNTSDLIKPLLAWGFLRQNDQGVFGLGARVQGSHKKDPDDPKTECPTCGRKLSEDENCVVCTYHIPEYAFVAAKRLSENDFQNWLQGWVTRKEGEKERIAEETKRVRQEVLAELKTHCLSFGIELKNGTPKSQNSGQKEWSVQTTRQARSVQTTESASYKAAEDGVQSENGAPIKERREEKKLASSADGEAQALEQEVRSRIQASKLEKLGDESLDDQTVRNIRIGLQRVPEDQRKEVLEILEQKCRSLAKGRGGAETWGWLVGMVRSEATKRSDRAKNGGHSISNASTAQRVEPVPEESANERIARLEDQIQAWPNHLQVDQWRAELDLLRKLRGKGAAAGGGR